MNTRFIVFFAVFIATTYALPTSDSNEQAVRYLSQRITAILNVLKIIRNDINETPKKLEKEKDSINFDIPKNAQIIEIEEILQNSSNENIDKCRDLYHNQVKSVKEELKNVLTREVTAQLQQYTQSLNYVEQVLTNLNENVKLCEGNVPTENSQCNQEDLEKYSIALYNYEKLVENLNNFVSFITDLILSVSVKPIVPNEINVKVYQPVTECIKQL